MQQKTKRTNELKLNINPNYNFNTGELQDLVAMANECAVKGWYVVQSRNIIASITKQVDSYDDGCEEDVKPSSSRLAYEEDSKSSILEPKNVFLLFPNPNNGQMELAYTIHNKQAAQLIIMDVTGRLINQYDLPENSSNLQINELELKSGVYFYTIKQNNFILKQAKFVIMK